MGLLIIRVYLVTFLSTPLWSHPVSWLKTCLLMASKFTSPAQTSPRTLDLNTQQCTSIPIRISNRHQELLSPNLIFYKSSPYRLMATQVSSLFHQKPSWLMFSITYHVLLALLQNKFRFWPLPRLLLSWSKPSSSLTWITRRQWPANRSPCSHIAPLLSLFSRQQPKWPSLKIFKSNYIPLSFKPSHGSSPPQGKAKGL